MTEDSRKRSKKELTKWFRAIYDQFLRDNKGCSTVLDYIEKEFDGDKDYWAKVARWAGHKCIKRNGIYYFEA